MSLFSLRSLWAYTPLSNEQFDSRHIAVGVIDPSGEQKVLLGSYSGRLRIFKPGAIFKQTDLVFQQTYPEPIVAVKVGYQEQKFEEAETSVLVLFARKLLILSFESSESILTLLKSQEHTFPSPSFTCFSRPLLSVGLNSQLYYLSPPSTISIKVSQPIYACCMAEDESFYYVDGEDLVMAKAGMEQWRILVGEINEIHLYKDGDKTKLVCVGEEEYWVVSKYGAIEYVKTIQGQISSSLLVKNDHGFNIVLGTFSKLLLIYDNGKLIWGAKTPFIPISIKTISISTKVGILCLLSDTGAIEICYLGTDQLTETIEPLVPATDLKELQSEIYRLEQELKAKETTTVSEQKPNLLTVDFIHCKAQWTDDYVEDDEKLFQINRKKRVLSCKLRLNPTGTLFDVAVQLKLPTNMYCQNMLLSIDQLQAPEQHQFRIYLQLNHFPYADKLKFSISYFSSSLKRDLKSLSAEVAIPFSFQCLRSTVAEKDKSNHKIILHSNKDLPKIHEIFSDVEVYEEAPNEMQIFFLLSSNIYTSILASKHAFKYKISSSFYEGLWIVINEFIKRTRKFGVELTAESVPLEELFVISESHFKAQNTLSSLKLSLEQSSKELKVVQKKILLKIKDKNCDLTVLQQLLNVVSASSVSMCNRYQQLQHQLQAITHQLMISVLIVCQLLFLRGKISQEGRESITGVLRVQQKGKYNEEWTWQQQVLVNGSRLQGKKITKSELEGLEFEKIRKVLLWIVDKTAKGEIK